MTSFDEFEPLFSEELERRYELYRSRKTWEIEERGRQNEIEAVKRVVKLLASDASAQLTKDQTVPLGAGQIKSIRRTALRVAQSCEKPAERVREIKKQIHITPHPDIPRDYYGYLDYFWFNLQQLKQVVEDYYDKDKGPSSQVLKACVRVDRKGAPFYLRHREMRFSGVDIKTVQELLGHCDERSGKNDMYYSDDVKVVEEFVKTKMLPSFRKARRRLRKIRHSAAIATQIEAGKIGVHPSLPQGTNNLCHDPESRALTFGAFQCVLTKAQNEVFDVIKDMGGFDGRPLAECAVLKRTGGAALRDRFRARNRQLFQSLICVKNGEVSINLKAKIPPVEQQPTPKGHPLRQPTRKRLPQKNRR